MSLALQVFSRSSSHYNALVQRSSNGFTRLHAAMDVGADLQAFLKHLPFVIGVPSGVVVGIPETTTPTINCRCHRRQMPRLQGLAVAETAS